MDRNQKIAALFAQWAQHNLPQIELCKTFDPLAEQILHEIDSIDLNWCHPSDIDNLVKEIVAYQVD